MSIRVVMTAYNAEKFIKEAIESIISQKFKNWNLFVVDGNSNIETQKILKKYINHPKINIIWLKKNKRAGFCRNLAIRSSRAKYIAFIDSDDIWDKEKLSKQLLFMIKNKYYFTYTNYYTFNSGDDKKDISRKINVPKYFTFEKFIKNTSIATSTMIIKRSAVGNIKFTNSKICEDYFFKCQILKKVNYYLNSPSESYQHPYQIHHHNSQFLQMFPFHYKIQY